MTTTTHDARRGELNEALDHDLARSLTTCRHPGDTPRTWGELTYREQQQLVVMLNAYDTNETSVWMWPVLPATRSAKHRVGQNDLDGPVFSIHMFGRARWLVALNRPSAVASAKHRVAIARYFDAASTPIVFPQAQTFDRIAE